MGVDQRLVKGCGQIERRVEPHVHQVAFPLVHKALTLRFAFSGQVNHGRAAGAARDQHIKDSSQPLAVVGERHAFESDTRALRPRFIQEAADRPVDEGARFERGVGQQQNSGGGPVGLLYLFDRPRVSRRGLFDRWLAVGERPFDEIDRGHLHRVAVYLELEVGLRKPAHRHARLVADAHLDLPQACFAAEHRLLLRRPPRALTEEGRL